jgi:hypothetical protein
VIDMCRHCASLVEDKDFVHRFMELAAIRANEKAHRDGIALFRPICADDIDVEYHINVSRDGAGPSLTTTGWARRIERALLESS